MEKADNGVRMDNIRKLSAACTEVLQFQEGDSCGSGGAMAVTSSSPRSAPNEAEEEFAVDSADEAEHEHDLDAEADAADEQEDEEEHAHDAEEVHEDNEASADIQQRDSEQAESEPEEHEDNHDETPETAEKAAEDEDADADDGHDHAKDHDPEEGTKCLQVRLAVLSRCPQDTSYSYYLRALLCAAVALCIPDIRLESYLFTSRVSCVIACATINV